MGVSSDDRWNDGPIGKEAWRGKQSLAASRLREPSDTMKRIETERSQRIASKQKGQNDNTMD